MAKQLYTEQIMHNAFARVKFETISDFSMSHIGYAHLKFTNPQVHTNN